MKELALKAYGKINLSLEIVGKRGDMHLIESLACHIDLFDSIKVRKEVYSSVEYSVPGITRGSVERALDALRDMGYDGLKVQIRKNLPIAGGMGGSSADAAAVLAAAGYIFDIDRDTLLSMAKRCGSDTPFMLFCPMGIIRGTGETLEKINSVPLSLVAIRRGSGVTSADCYAQFDKLKTDDVKGDVYALIKAIESKDLQTADALSHNALSRAATLLSPDLRLAFSEFSRVGKKGHMTGSGNTVFCFTENSDDSDRVFSALDKSFSPIKLQNKDAAWEIY